MNEIATFPHMKLRGWDAGPTQGLVTSTVVDLDGFSEPQTTDAMAVAYLVPGEASFPRLNTGALATLRDAGQEPLLHWVILDLDNEGHKAWASPVEAVLALMDAIGKTGLPMGGYTTRAGLRLMAPLDPPLPVSVANSWLAQFGATLALDIDPASYEWTRFMRLPRAKRDGQVLDAGILLDNMAPLDPHSFGFTLTEQTVATTDWGEAPPEPVNLTWKEWAHASDMDWARGARPVPEDDSGSCYGTARTALARIAGRGNISDPHTLASFLWGSVLATTSSSLNIAELWKLACWVADRQELDETTPKERVETLPQGEPSPEEWALIKRLCTGRYSPHYGKMRDGLPLCQRPASYESTTYSLLRTLVMGSDYPADLYYRALARTLDAQKAPLPPAVWARCQDLVEERDTMGDSDERLRKAFVQANPLTLACPDAGTPLFQLNTLTTPYSYVATSEQLIENDFERFTKPGLPFEADYSSVPVRAILRDYGGRVENVAYSSGQEGCRFDAANGTIHLGVHQLKQVSPVFHPEVDQWLRLLGASDPEGLLDWLACVTYTVDQPLCALYIKGAPGIGKSLLGNGIASLWGTAPCSYNKIANADFNAELQTCPLVFADEGIVVDKSNASRASLVFRNMVADTVHHINAKFRQPIPLRGALRILICANDDQGLPFRESLGADGIEAIVQRVMYIEADPRAGDIIRHAGGREGIGNTWAPPSGAPGYIAEHLMWLRENRRAAPSEGGRFMVTGRPTTWHRQFGVRQGLKPSALQVVFALLQRAEAGVAGAPDGVRNDPDKRVVWVSARPVLDTWDTLARSFRAKPAAIKDSLQQLSSDHKKVRFGKNSYWAYALPWSAFVDAAVCDLSDLGGA
jgi:hypothetical protein